MDRRQRKTREAIFKSFINLLSEKHYNNITVGEIIENADIGRATFYSHFETKDFLLKELCDELFCHIFDVAQENDPDHKHIFTCNSPTSILQHLLQHLKNNDNNLLSLLKCENNEIFLRYFKENLKYLIQKNPNLFLSEKYNQLPESYWVNHISSSFMETVKWWADNGTKESPERLSEYFLKVIQ